MSDPRDGLIERPQQTGLQPLPAAKRTGTFDPLPPIEFPES